MQTSTQTIEIVQQTLSPLSTLTTKKLTVVSPKHFSANPMSSPIRIAPTIKKPKDLEGSFHVDEDDVDLFNLLDDETEKQVAANSAPPLVPPPMARGRPGPVKRRGSITSSASHSSSGSHRSSRSSKSHRRRSSMATTVSSSSNHSRSSRNLRRSTGKNQTLLEQQMGDLSISIH